MSDEAHPDEAAEPTAGQPAPTVDVKELLGERKEVWLEWDGQRYRLRVTRRGRLILTK
jgi:hemin uptake protein HemP